MVDHHESSRCDRCGQPTFSFQPTCYDCLEAENKRLRAALDKCADYFEETAADDMFDLVTQVLKGDSDETPQDT